MITQHRLRGWGHSLPGKATGLLKGRRLLLLIAALTALVRLPSLFEPLWYGDEAIYLTIGQQILRGDVLYEDIFDNKTPGIYYLAAGGLALFGHSVWSVKLLLFFWSICTVFVSYFLARRLSGETAAAPAAAVLSLLTAPVWLEGNIYNSEILMILPACLGVLSGFSGRPFLAGSFFSLAVLFKVPAVFDFAAYFLFVALSVDRGSIKRAGSELIRLVAGFLAPVAVTALYFAANGAFLDYVRSAFLFNTSYASYGNRFLFDNGMLVVKALPIVALVMFLAAGTARRWTRGEQGGRDAFPFLLLWFFFSFYGALFGGRPYEHYLIQAVPAFSLLAAYGATNAGVRRYVSLAVVAATLIYVLNSDFDVTNHRAYRSYYRNFAEYASGAESFEEYANNLDGNTGRNYDLAAFLREDARDTNAKLFVFADQPSIYFLSRLSPAARYVAYYHITDREGRESEAARQVEEAAPLYILVQQPELGPFPDLKRIIADDYRLVESRGGMAVYKRLAPGKDE